MAAFQFPNPVDSQSVTNPVTGITYIWKESPGKWVIQNTTGDGEIDFPDFPTPEPSDFNLPYSLDVGERDSETGEDVSAFQILETIALKDALGNNLGDVAFESSGGIGVSIDSSYSYPVIAIQATNLDTRSKTNAGRVYAEELRSAIYPKTYTLVNRLGIPTARPGELAIDATHAQDIKAMSFGDTSSEGLSIGTVSVGDKLCITRVDLFRQWFYSITSGTTNSGIYGVEFIAENSWNGTANVPENDYILEVFPRATPFGSSVDLDNYYDKSEIDAKFAAGLMPGDVDASDYWTKNEVAAALESVRAGLQENIDTTNDLIVPPGQNNPETYYGDYAPTGNLLNGDLWFDAMNLRLNVWSQGAWINPDRNDGAELENRISALEVRISQLEGN